MDVRQLRYFVAIADAGSLSRASERLHVAQPALSLQLASLEAECGSKLFDRHHRGVSLTSSGVILLRHAEAILRMVTDAAEAVRSESSAIGEVSIGLPTTVTDLFVGRLLARARDKHPQIRLRVYENTTGALVDMLDQGMLDLSILMNSPEGSSTSNEHLLVESYCLVSPPDTVVEGPTIRWAELLKLPLILPGAGSLLRQMLEEAALQAGSRLISMADLDSARLLKASVMAGIGHTILPRSSVSDPRDIGTMKVRLITHPEVKAALQLSISTIRAATPAQLAIRSLIVQLVRDSLGTREWQADP